MMAVRNLITRFQDEGCAVEILHTGKTHTDFIKQNIERMSTRWF